MRIGICEKNRDPYFDIVNRGFLTAGRRLGFESVIVAPGSEDICEQERLVRGLIDQRVDALAVVASDPTALNMAIGEAMARGIPTICFDLDAPDSQRLLYVGTEAMTSLGRRAAGIMAGLLAPGAQVAVQGGSEWAAGATGKRNGFIEAARTAGLEVVEVLHDNHDPETALVNARHLLAKYPDLSGIFGVYGYHPGAQIRALRELGVHREICIVGFDILPETIQGLKSGEIAASVWIREYHFGYLGGAVLFNMLTLGIEETLAMLGLDSDPGPTRAIRLAPSVLTPDNLGEFLREYGSVVGV